MGSSGSSTSPRLYYLVVRRGGSRGTIVPDLVRTFKGTLSAGQCAAEELERRLNDGRTFAEFDEMALQEARDKRDGAWYERRLKEGHFVTLFSEANARKMSGFASWRPNRRTAA